MIKLNRSVKPRVLEENETIWQHNLASAISKYGSYSAIPKEEKEQLVSHYRHGEIKEKLFSSSFEKCAFCECKPAEGGNIEVEHFRPKSIYPDLTFDWNNLLPSCRKCNGNKLDHDTGLMPIINPYDMEPEEFFFYSDIKILSIGDNELGKKTIEICGLNSIRLMKPRADILVSLHGFSESLEEAISDYKDCSTETKKRNRLRKINEAVERIEQLANPVERYSGFCKFYLTNCKPYIEAKSILDRLNATALEQFT